MQTSKISRIFKKIHSLKELCLGGLALENVASRALLVTDMVALQNRCFSKSPYALRLVLLHTVILVQILLTKTQFCQVQVLALEVSLAQVC